MKKKKKSFTLQISFVATDETNVSLAFCFCPIGLSVLCAHDVGALYQLAHYKAHGYRSLPVDVAKTSQPQTFHVPRGTKVQGKAVQDLQVWGYSRKRADQSGTLEDIPRNIPSTLYNPIRGERVIGKTMSMIWKQRFQTYLYCLLYKSNKICWFQNVLFQFDFVTVCFLLWVYLSLPVIAKDLLLLLFPL